MQNKRSDFRLESEPSRSKLFDGTGLPLALTSIRQGANGYVLSMGTKIWDPEQSPEQGPEQTPEQGPEWKY